MTAYDDYKKYLTPSFEKVPTLDLSRNAAMGAPSGGDMSDLGSAVVAMAAVVGAMGYVTYQAMKKPVL